MLQVKDICKEYRTGSLVQKALNHVSLNLRDNEFVAILGPSGSGKTTLLNIIGGLDRYDSGDLVINGVSTKKYKDRDWDSYRNHTIGFVFQSYNLIPHQTILANVELALTIGGISRSERKRRAIDALQKVGLGEQLHKKPSQMSGGQMQRVAIARALVNDPDILLADEPTGALDSETSIQVMDLLKEVANDRLVVMVTHNPELAQLYATRIVTLKDGVIRGDTDPYAVESDEGVHKNFGRASMSFLTALGLSFNNLKTKLARTLLIALAGSIGITGIALILSLSNGVNQYIKGVEEDTLSEYPLEISGSSFDITSFMGVEAESRESDAEVVEWKTISNMLTKFSANDLKSLRDYLDSDGCNIGDYARAVEYGFDFAPEIYRIDGDRYYQVNPDSTFSKMGLSGIAMYSPGAGTNSFMALPEKSDLYKGQYDVVAGHWPENDRELVLVLTANGRVADLTLYGMGMRDHEELDALIKLYLTQEDIEIPDTIGEYLYQDFLGLSFKLVNSCDYYQYDSEYNVWTNKSEDKDYMMDLIQKGTDLTIVGVVKPKEDASVAMLSTGVYYSPALVRESIQYAAKSEIVKAQLRNPDTDIISNTPFGEESESKFDLQNIFSFDETAFRKAFQFTPPDMQTDPGSLDLSDMDLEGMGVDDIDMADLLGKIKVNIQAEDLTSLFSDLLADYAASQGGDPTTDIANLPASFLSYLATNEARAILERNFEKITVTEEFQNILKTGLQDAVTAVVNGYLSYAEENGITDLTGLGDYLRSGEASAILSAQVEQIAGQLAQIRIPQEILDTLQQELLDGYRAYAEANELPNPDAIRQRFEVWLQSDAVRDRIMETVEATVDTSELEAEVTAMTGTVMENLMTAISREISGKMADMMGSMTNSLRVDTGALESAFQINMTETELQELMATMMKKTMATLESNLSKMGYMDLEKPSSITIYPIDFASKTAIKDILNGYNDQMHASGQEEKVVSYTDVVGTLMNSVTEIINAISYVLVAFVAISLVVSSIMIGVITYISVLERKKEIGILRAIGASKRNISAVFNAETFIIGLLAGLIGIAMTHLILIPGNILIHHLTGMDSISAILPPEAGIILVALSVILTLLGGLLPSKKAAKSDPVTALRTE